MAALEKRIQTSCCWLRPVREDGGYVVSRGLMLCGEVGSEKDSSGHGLNGGCYSGIGPEASVVYGDETGGEAPSTG